MRSRNRFLAAAGLAAALGLSATLPASAGATLSIGTVTRNGASATVSGAAAFDAITAAQSVIGTSAVFGGGLPNEVADPAGLQLTGAKIAPLADGSGLRFIWEVKDLPEQIPPEGVRYNWAIDIGQNTYQLQAKRTNMLNVTTTEDPLGHARQLPGNFFQLRGNCVANYFGTPQPVAGCYHYAWLQGAFDIANNSITIDWPFNTKDSINRIVAPDFKPGAVVVAHDGSKSATMSIAASGQAVVSNTQVSKFINSWSSYFIGPKIQLGVGPADADPASVEYASTANLTGGSFTGTVSGLDEDNNAVFVRACNGAECTYASKAV